MEIKEEASLSHEDITYNIFLNIKNSLGDLVNNQSKDDFLTFVRAMAPTLVSDWKMCSHIELLSDRLQLVVEGKIKRLIVLFPPRLST